MRVLLISHTCQSASEGQPKAWELAQIPNVKLMVLTPDRWLHYGKWRAPELPQNAPFELRAGRVMWPWLGKAQNYAHWYPGLAKVIRDFKPDIIDLWEEPWGLVSAHACWLRDKKFPHIKIISETEQNLNKTLPPPFEKWRSYTLNRADFCIARSEEARQVLISKGYNGKSEVVPNAVDAEMFRSLDKPQCREKLGANGFVVGYIGRLVEEKGLMDLIDALPFCDEDVNVLFVGDGELRESLQHRAAQNGSSTRVRFLAGVPASELPPIMNALDALVLPSRTTPSWKEQFGRVIIEAHACEVPVIGSSSGAIPEVVGEAGLVFPEGDARALSQSIETLRENPQRAREMGKIGRAKVEASYTWRRVAEQMFQIYTRVLDS